MANYVLDGVILFAFEDDRLAMHLQVAVIASAVLFDMSLYLVC